MASRRPCTGHSGLFTRAICLLKWPGVAIMQLRPYPNVEAESAVRAQGITSHQSCRSRVWQRHQRVTERRRRGNTLRSEAENRTQEPQSWQERAQATAVDLLPPGLREGPPRRPPPPPPPPETQSGGSKRAQAAILSILVAITLLWFKFYQSLLPELHKDEFGVTYVTTKAGNQVAVAEDSRGRTFFIDKAGNLYYDTEDVNIGAYMVDVKGSVYNLWIDKQDQPQKKYVGELSDLQTMDIRSLAGIPVRELQREFGGRFDGQATFFQSTEDFLLPPNAPVLTDEKDGSVEGPPILEEGVFRD